jgi:hypothetical protein
MSRKAEYNGIALLALNEVNFDLVQAYAQSGELPNLAGLVRRHGLQHTQSESEYTHIEPWIQWVTVHTGLSFAEHGVFRLGDIIETKFPQLWETIERLTGRPTVAICPMNARNASGPGSVFIADPWTATETTGPRFVRRLAGAISRFVNNNSSGGASVSDYLILAAALVRYGKPGHWFQYVKLAVTSRGRSWRKAMLLDLLLTDLFVFKTRKRRPVFASLFLNAAAHIQHHYMMSSEHVSGENPEWYVQAGLDPLLEVYRLYDRLVADVQARLPGYRLIIATGLHQDPCPEPIYYWRPRAHAGMLALMGLADGRATPRMSRDFVVEYDDVERARQAAERLEGVRLGRGGRFFKVDQRGHSLFVEIIYEADLLDSDYLVDSAGTTLIERVKAELSFVAIKNGIHNGLGYVIDTSISAAPKHPNERPMPLSQLHSMILDGIAQA